MPNTIIWRDKSILSHLLLQNVVVIKTCDYTAYVSTWGCLWNCQRLNSVFERFFFPFPKYFIKAVFFWDEMFAGLVDQRFRLTSNTPTCMKRIKRSLFRGCFQFKRLIMSNLQQSFQPNQLKTVSSNRTRENMPAATNRRNLRDFSIRFCGHQFQSHSAQRLMQRQ